MNKKNIFADVHLQWFALTADRDVDSVGPIEILHTVGGATDILYKGGIVMIGTDGLLAVVSDVTNAWPIGLMKKQVSAAGSNAENIEVLQGKFWLPMTAPAAAQTHVGEAIYASDDATITPTASTNIGPLGMCVDYKSGYLLVDTRIRALE